MRRIRQKLAEFVAQAYEEGYRKFISGMALGVDTWAAEAVLDFRSSHSDVSLWCAVPFLRQPLAWKERATRTRWLWILESANAVILVDPRPEFTTAHNLRQSLERLVEKEGRNSPEPDYARKLQVRNEWMIDQGDCLLAVWGGGHGGTFNAVRYAASQGKDIVRWDPFTDETTVIAGT